MGDYCPRCGSGVTDADFNGTPIVQCPSCLWEGAEEHLVDEDDALLLAMEYFDDSPFPNH